MKTTLLLTLTLTSAGTAWAQTPAASMKVDARFAGWLGCWRLDDDLTGTGARMCITPDATGVRFQTIAGKARGINELVIADGTSHAIVDSECTGTDRTEWSKDGQRLFRKTDVACGTDGARAIQSLAFLTPAGAWIQAQQVTGADGTRVRVQRYRRSANQSLADGSRAPQADAAVVAAAAQQVAPWALDDVIEASAKVPAEVLQAALTETNQRFDINRKSLIAMDKAGVRPEVIDLMVALTYPEKFTVVRAGSASMPMAISTGSGWLDPFMEPMVAGSYAGGYGTCYTPYGYGYRSYYGMCSAYGASYLSSYYAPGYYMPGGSYSGWVDVGALQPPSGGTSTTPPSADGRMVAGRGYTQIRSRDPEPAPRSGNASGNGSAAGAAGGGNVTSQGYSGGSSTSGSGGSSGGGNAGTRTAVPKGPGGGH